MGNSQYLPKPPEEPTWLLLARSLIGEKEIAGGKDNPFILNCFSYTTFPKDEAHDEIPWCAAFLCKILEDSGYASTRNAAAESYLTYGEASELIPGAIIVFKWSSGDHHVTLLDHVIDSNLIACTGGNQLNQVMTRSYDRKYIQAVRWPVKNT